MAILTGLSGHEIYCLEKKGFLPGDLVIGNSVMSMGFIGGLASGLKTLVGGEVEQVTSIIHEGRQRAYQRMEREAHERGDHGITGVSSELVQHGGNVEFLAVGSSVRRAPEAPETQTGAARPDGFFSTAADGQELYCQLDAGFAPIRFVFGNVAYSIGIGGGIMGMLRGLGRGEVHEYSEIFNHTRHHALERITKEAQTAGGNAVVGIRTLIMPFQGMQEMIMIGTASRHRGLPPPWNDGVITSDMTNEEMWNIIRAGYVPIRLVLGVSVYSLGIAGGVTSLLKSFVRGEIPELTSLIYEARENALARVEKDAAAAGADDVVGIKTYVYQLAPGMLEFMAVGTAVKRMDLVRTASEQLPTQAVVRDKQTFHNLAERPMGIEL
ncbi:MAG: heavy metal-binding domain-containing protein [Elusimicrobia bacterium]|nr:heavy metal-binding domain-containing protein [Elusimicrobiota bacterium]